MLCIVGICVVCVCVCVRARARVCVCAVCVCVCLCLCLASGVLKHTGYRFALPDMQAFIVQDYRQIRYNII